MSIFKVKYAGEFEDEEFDTYEEADEYGMEIVNAAASGAEVLHLSNPGDYDEDDYVDDYEVVEIEN